MSTYIVSDCPGCGWTGWAGSRCRNPGCRLGPLARRKTTGAPKQPNPPGTDPKLDGGITRSTPRRSS